MLKILPYKLGSKSAKDLARSLRVKRIIPGGNYRPPARALIVNWGNSKHLVNHLNVLNKPQAIATASNKLRAFQAMKAAGVTTPEFTTSKEVAQEWQEDGFRVMCRTLLNSHSGKGIIVAQPDDALPYAPLYTKYTKKEKEFRVHVFKGRIIDICEKRKRHGHEEGNSLIRTLNNGWVYCRENVNIAELGKNLSIAAVRALGLDFGAVDLIARGNNYYVLEVNCAPGLQGTTLQKYAEALRTYV
jgi:glutathione synthase/RimK-type ligase-like ATP-grasp enzyme